MNLSIKSDVKDIKIKDITDVKDKDKYYLKILNDDLNLAFKLNK